MARVRISGCVQLEDECLRCIGQYCKQLQNATVSGCSVSAESIEELKLLCPNAAVLGKKIKPPKLTKRQRKERKKQQQAALLPALVPDNAQEETAEGSSSTSGEATITTTTNNPTNQNKDDCVDEKGQDKQE